MATTRLTQFSSGGGCGCKIAPAVLEELLSGTKQQVNDKRILVGSSDNDDAVVYDLGNEQALISTTDFFTPIVDDPFMFGKIAAANALSDVYAMGGKPIFALGILAWPLSKLPIELAREVLNGARAICDEATITLAGGHSIDIPEPVFGLAVNGLISKKHIKKNNSVQNGDVLLLSKKIGTGMISSALKRDLLADEDVKEFYDQIVRLNKEGEYLAHMDDVHAMTDVTGFALLGHLHEMLVGKSLAAEIDYESVQLLPQVKELATKFVYPDNTMRNWKAYEYAVEGIAGESLLTLCDPQTNGGLLISVKADAVEVIQKKFPHFFVIGKITEQKNEKSIRII